ncbi:MAG: hypothetical protein J1F35_04155 [Erysipelotrichales bacterium]|nr:hypothetical protein [Erysipelotrichales bacterium]
MKLDYFLNKYIVVEKKDGKKIEGILIDILDQEDSEETAGFITLVIRVDDNKFKNIHLIEIENIGTIE